MVAILLVSIKSKMAEPTLAQIFGATASQTSTTVTLTKADFAGVGLTAQSSNTAESLLAAIVVFAQQTLTSTNQATNADQSIIIADSIDSITVRSGVSYRRKTKNISFDKVDTTNTFDPDDY